jgi:ubiquinone/menaquinone biosynthesis C-methylase UbiE
MKQTSWENSSKWYGKIVGREGHYFHQTIIFPKIRQLIDWGKVSSVFDFGCGQGVFERQLNPKIEYMGIDAARSLIREAEIRNSNPKHKFIVADVSKSLPIKENYYDVGVIILALQNIKNVDGVIENAKKHLKVGGRFLIVLNHPMFRIPRQTSWGVDENSKTQYRRIDGYMTEKEIPILTHPGKFSESEKTWSFHYPLSKYSQILAKNGLVIEIIDEWVSGKKSTGSKAKMEDRARREIPMFMTILARKS